jgi:4-hydroxy-tetrahydrodipicolinate synthase
MNLNQYKLWTAVITPMNDQHQVDFEALTAIIKDQCEANNGLLVLGSTGEALNITLDEKKKIVEHVINLKPLSPIMVGVGGHQLQETMDWVKYLETQQIHAYLMVTPLYAKPGPVGQYQWFKALMDASTKPVMLYNVPGRTAVALSTEAVAQLSNHKNFWAIKEASGSVEKFKDYLKAANGKAVYCGDDALMPEFALAGSSGLVSVASNSWPAETNLYVEKCLTKTFDDKALWTEASNSLFLVSNPVPVKRLMYETGKIKTPFMFAPLSHEDLKDITKLQIANEQVKAWYKRNTK